VFPVWRVLYWRCIRVHGWEVSKGRLQIHPYILLGFIFSLYYQEGAHGSIIGWGIMLQAGMMRVRFPVSLYRSVDVILLTSPPSVSWLFMKCGNLDGSQPYGRPWPVTGIGLRRYFT
jgi:hypothetical protein